MSLKVGIPGFLKLLAGRHLRSFVFVFGALLLGLVFSGNAAAQTVTAKAAVGPSLSDSTLVFDQVIEISIFLDNGAILSTTPIPTPLQGKFVNGAQFKVNLATTDGLTPINGTFAFVPGPLPSNCFSDPLGAFGSCVFDGNNVVTITLDQDIDMSAGQTNLLAGSFRVQAVKPVNPPANGAFITSAITNFGDFLGCFPNLGNNWSDCNFPGSGTGSSGGFFPGAPKCTVSKSVTPTVTKVGDQVTYSLGPLCNTGDVPLSLVSCNDTVTGDCSAAIASCFPLDVGKCCSPVSPGGDPPGTAFATVPYTIKASDADPLVNTMTVTCSGAGQNASCEASASVNLFSPSITCDKTVTPNLSKIGDPVTYTLTLNNTSSADTPPLVCTKTDTVLGINHQVTLNSGQSDVETVPFTIPAGASDPFNNTVNYSCSPQGFPNVLTCQHSASVNLFQPSITCAKDVTPKTSKIGDSVTYTLTLVNTSSADTPALECTKNDPVLGITNKPITLNPGQSDVETVPFTIPADASNPFNNTVTYSCSPQGFPNVLPCEASVPVNLVKPSCTIAKTCTPKPLVIGQPINWDVTVCNTGTVGLDIHVVDATAGIDQTVTLAEGCQTLTASRTVTAEDCPAGISNTATASWSITGGTLPNTGDCTGPATDTCECQPPPGTCRMTGGHVAMANVDSTFLDPESGTHYSTGGQIGAPQELGCREYPQKGKCVDGVCTGGLLGGQACDPILGCPNDTGRNSQGPWGDWEHNHHSGPDDLPHINGGSFAFHSGTAAAPDTAFIKSIICADEGWCVQARPAPFKQIFWEGTGVFHNMKGAKNKDIPLPTFPDCAVQPVPWSNKNGGTLHYYRAHVGDFGEPAGIRQKPAEGCTTWFNEVGSEPGGQVGIEQCALTQDPFLLPGQIDEVKTALHPLCTAQQCEECPDWYEIEIHCTDKPDSPVMYRVAHHITEGNFQLHPPVGASCQACGDGICQIDFDEDCFSCPEDCGEPVDGSCQQLQ